MNDSFEDAVFGFELFNRTANKSPHTLTSYGQHLQRLHHFLSERKRAPDGGPLAEVTTDDLRQFIAHLQGETTCYQAHPFRRQQARPLSPHTIKGVVAVASAFFAWCVAEGLLDKNPMERVPKPKAPREIKDKFSQEEVQKLLDACKGYPPLLRLRNRAIVFLLSDTGIRAAELCALAVGDVNLKEGCAKIHGKGARDRLVPLGKLCQRALWDYVRQRPASEMVPNLFLTHRLLPILPDELTRILRRLGEIAGVADVHPHKFRHTAARTFIRNGGGEFALQKILGHADLATTRIYAELEREDVEAAHMRASPADRWNLK